MYVVIFQGDYYYLFYLTYLFNLVQFHHSSTEKKNNKQIK